MTTEQKSNAAAVSQGMPKVPSKLPEAGETKEDSSLKATEGSWPFASHVRTSVVRRKEKLSNDNTGPLSTTESIERHIQANCS